MEAYPRDRAGTTRRNLDPRFLLFRVGRDCVASGVGGSSPLGRPMDVEDRVLRLVFEQCWLEPMGSGRDLARRCVRRRAWAVERGPLLSLVTNSPARGTWSVAVRKAGPATTEMLKPYRPLRRAAKTRPRPAPSAGRSACGGAGRPGADGPSAHRTSPSIRLSSSTSRSSVPGVSGVPRRVFSFSRASR